MIDLSLIKPEEIPYYSLILGKCYDLYFPPIKNSNNINVDWLVDAEKIYEVFNKITPVHSDITRLDLALKVGDVVPQKIEKEFVHKKDVENVMISKPQRFGNMWYFNMLERSKEFNFDHESDHLQGMLLTEVARQTGIATVHLNGLSIKGKLNMSEMRVVFNNYAEIGSPVVVRSISGPSFISQGQYSKYYIAVNLIQFGKICVSVYFKGVMFNSENGLNDYRSRSKKINKNIEIKYQNFLNETCK